MLLGCGRAHGSARPGGQCTARPPPSSEAAANGRQPVERAESPRAGRFGLTGARRAHGVWPAVGWGPRPLAPVGARASAARPGQLAGARAWARGLARQRGIPELLPPPDEVRGDDGIFSRRVYRRAILDRWRLAMRGMDLVPVDALRPWRSRAHSTSSSTSSTATTDHKLYGDDRRAQLEAFAARHPAVLVVDPPHTIDRLHNRISMLQVVISDLDHAANKDRTFGIPSQVVVYDAAALADSGLLAALRFPLITEPLVADGTAKSHKMSLVYHREGLGKLRPPLEFVNHGGVIFKVYVGGGHVTCVKHRSLPDVSPEDDASAEGSVSFSQGPTVVEEKTLAGSPAGRSEPPSAPVPTLAEAASRTRRRGGGIRGGAAEEGEGGVADPPRRRGSAVDQARRRG
uniref:Uncharacterized protein n=1 Tax=Setaria viridis TaxID=4556 RepID=A0A4U6SW17_SETVI|nr:LOW QUALITY PROTEIN: hypothetical protein SEVIR_9G197000v2 [Setaria viridis]